MKTVDEWLASLGIALVVSGIVTAIASRGPHYTWLQYMLLFAGTVAIISVVARRVNREK